jgi:hypothetical protein
VANRPKRSMSSPLIRIGVSSVGFLWDPVPRRGVAGFLFGPIAEPGQSHEIDEGAWQCDASLIRVFVEHANAKQLNASCLTQVVLPSFPTVW